MVETFTIADEPDKFTKGIQKMYQTGECGDGVNYVVQHKSQVMTKLMLLEKIATVLGFTAGDECISSREPSTELINTKLQPVIKVASRWHRYCDDIRQQITHHEPYNDTGYSRGIPENPNESQQRHHHALDLLARATTCFQESQYLIASGNLQLVAFMLSWHSTVSFGSLPPLLWCSQTGDQRNTPFPQKKEFFFHELNEVSARLGFPPVKESEDLFCALKSSLDIAVHVSPLTLLGAVPGTRFQMDRSALIKVRSSLLVINNICIKQYAF